MMSSRAKILFKVSRFYLAGEVSPGNEVVTKNVSNLRSSASMGDRLEIDVMCGR